VFNSNGVGFGPFRVPFAEIEAFAKSQGLYIKPWEALLIRHLSEVYIMVDDERSKKKPAPTLESLMAELDDGEEPEIRVAIPKGMTKVVPVSDIDGIKAMFRNMDVQKRRKADGPRNDRPQSG
jgi:hypothetical protein